MTAAIASVLPLLPVETQLHQGLRGLHICNKPFACNVLCISPHHLVWSDFFILQRALRITPAQKAQQEALFDSFKKRLQRLRKERDGVVDRIKRVSQDSPGTGKLQELIWLYV